ncbi:MAG: hypothetical protein WED07_06740 [Candidatus Freyarchaeum deiterrae]
MKTEKNLKKIFKLGGITNISPPLAEKLKIAPYIGLKVDKIPNPTDLRFKVELASKKNVFKKVTLDQSVSRDGKYLIPLPLEINKIPPEAKSVSLRVGLQVGKTAVSEKKTTVPISRNKNMLELSDPHIKGERIIAGDRQDYFCDLKNNSEKPISLNVEVLLIPLGGEEIKIFSEPRNIPPGRPEAIQARSIIPINSLGECFVVARVKFKQEEQEREQCTALKIVVQLSSEPIVKIRINESPKIPISITGGEKVNFNVKILQSVEPTKLRVDVLIVDENSENKLKTLQLNQQKGEQRMYGAINWDTPQVSETKECYIDFKVYKDNELLPDEMISKEKQKITLTPAQPQSSL